MRKSPHLRHYGKGISIAPTKIDYKVRDADIAPHVQAMIDLNAEYVAEDPLMDRSKGLCMLGHIRGEACRKLEGHNEC